MVRTVFLPPSASFSLSFFKKKKNAPHCHFVSGVQHGTSGNVAEFLAGWLAGWLGWQGRGGVHSQARPQAPTADSV